LRCMRIALVLRRPRRRFRARGDGLAQRCSDDPTVRAHLRRLEGAVVRDHRRSAPTSGARLTPAGSPTVDRPRLRNSSTVDEREALRDQHEGGERPGWGSHRHLEAFRRRWPPAPDRPVVEAERPGLGKKALASEWASLVEPGGPAASAMSASLRSPPGYSVRVLSHNPNI